MGQVSSKLHKNENTTDMSFYQIYLPKLHENIFKYHRLKLVTLVDGDLKAPFSITTTQRCKRGCYSISWIASLYPWSLPYKAEY